MRDTMVLDFEKYCQCARQAAAEGQVLLRNEGNVLPLKAGTKLAVFGRMQFHYYKSGTGSGGMVNVNKVTGILDALLECEEVTVDQELLRIYREWEETHPFDEGIGWGNEPWSQEEMVLTREVVSGAADRSDCAIVIIARTAGEDKDNKLQAGSYLLTDKEEQMLSMVRSHFERMVVLLNVGNIMDMGFVETYAPDAVLYAWQGGMIGGLATVDLLTGRISPSGKLSDTIACRLEDYPSDINFGDQDRNLYQEDIYVGYRYFETAAKEKVRYPFGFGLSYTEFALAIKDFALKEDRAELSVEITNIGKCSGKEVVQIYVSSPQGKLGKPGRVLAAFEKTRELSQGERQMLSFEIPFYQFASYDETGVTGFASCYVLEQGEYVFYAGSSVEAKLAAGSFALTETKPVMQCSQALAPVTPFKRMRPIQESGRLTMGWEDVPLRTSDPAKKRSEHLPKELPYTGDKGYKLADVKAGSVSLEEFVSQISDEDLACIVRGEGMGSPKVTPGTASAFGGVSEGLRKLGIPCGCCSDGPSGMRLDSGAKAFSLPNGTMLACTFNTELVEELYAFTGLEMVKNQVDILLGPGMNIHRHPLNGRNFEYFSEDPLLSGKIAAAQIRGFSRWGVTGSLKHFCANNQETCRRKLDSVISERALREIYLKGYEIAIRESNVKAIMTSYNPVNGLWTAGSYDLNTAILRQEWGFDGIVMTDWWAEINEENGPAARTNLAAMVRSQNDLYMVCQDSESNSSQDNLPSALAEGTLTRGELQRSAMNICSFLKDTYALERLNGREAKVQVAGEGEFSLQDEQEVIYYKIDRELTIDLSQISARKGSSFVFALELEKLGYYQVLFTAKSDLGELAQLPVTMFYQSVPYAVFTFNGTGGEWKTMEGEVGMLDKYAVQRIYFGQNGLDVKEVKFVFKREFNSIN